MEFLDANLTKELSLLLHAIHSSLYWRILKKIILFSGIKILTENPRNEKTWVYTWIAFCRTEKKGRKPDKNSSLRRLKFMPRNLD